MSYHNEVFIKEKDGVIAPKGFHYMPNGKLMSDADHIAMHGYIEKKITNFNIDTKDINYLGETRSFSVSGDKGAVFSLEIYDDATAPNYYNFSTNTWSTTKSGLYNIESVGNYQFSITFPVLGFVDATCDYNNDPTIAHDDDDGAIKVGMVVSGTGIPTGSTVASVTSDTSFELSASTTGGSVTNGTLSFILASDDVFLNEQVWKSDGTLFGTCTAVGGAAGMTFSGGIASAMVDDDDLYVGTRYHILKSYVLPANATLVLEKNELRVDPQIYTMYIKLSATDSAVDLITRK